MNQVLKDLRLEQNITQQEMAELINLKTASAYWKKEAGHIPFSLQEAKIIADFFDKPIEELFFASELYQTRTN